jgi:hypothetical protein
MQSKQLYSISEIFNKSMDFFKANYEYLVPYTIFYLFLSVIVSYTPIKSISIVMQILMIPLGFAVPFFIDSVNRGEEKSFLKFFQVYKALIPYLGAKLFGMLVAIICLMPLFFSVYNLLNEFQFDVNLLINEIQNGRVELPSSSKIKIAVSLFLMISTLPFYIFLEYFMILSKDTFETALKKSYHIGVRYYFHIIGLFISVFILMFIGFATCFFGLIVAIPLIYSMFYFSYNQLKNDFSTYKEA